MRGEVRYVEEPEGTTTRVVGDRGCVWLGVLGHFGWMLGWKGKCGRMVDWKGECYFINMAR